MRRRDFIKVIVGSATTWPFAVRAQQSAIPVIGFLGAGSAGPLAPQMAVFRQGLAEAGYLEGPNVAIEYRFAEGQYGRLSAMAEEMVRRQVAVIVAFPIPAAVAAKAATTTIPIVFNVAGDPVKLGLVAGLARPGGNATGVNSFLAELGAKHLGLLRELLPTATRVGLLVNPTNENVEGVTKDVVAAADTLRVQIDVVRASDSREIEAAFTTLVRNKADALLIGSDIFFRRRRVQLATFTTRHAIPAVMNVREFAEVGGLMSYGTDLTEVFRQGSSRRAFITLLGAAAAWPLAARAQQPAKLPLVGVLVSASSPHPFADAFWRGLHALGYSEGQNIKVEFRYTDGR